MGHFISFLISNILVTSAFYRLTKLPSSCSAHNPYESVILSTSAGRSYKSELDYGWSDRLASNTPCFLFLFWGKYAMHPCVHFRNEWFWLLTNFFFQSKGNWIFIFERSSDGEIPSLRLRYPGISKAVRVLLFENQTCRWPFCSEIMPWVPGMGV